MSGFNKPQDAFSTTGEKLAFGSNAFLHFYKLHASLKGHEIVVASSNNKAVENVSKELPLKEANGRHEQIAYFRSISDLIANPKRAGYFEAEAEGASPPTLSKPGVDRRSSRQEQQPRRVSARFLVE